MAATRLIPMHLQKSRSMGQCLKERTDYAKNDEKTEAGEYVSSYECDPDTVDLEFEITKNQYAVRRHIVGGANRTLFSVDLPPRWCRTGTCRRLQSE